MWRGVSFMLLRIALAGVHGPHGYGSRIEPALCLGNEFGNRTNGAAVDNPPG